MKNEIPVINLNVLNAFLVKCNIYYLLDKNASIA